MKIDLHVHSKFSTRPSQWILQKINCPESFTSPQKLHRIAKERGMDMVTISDHNTIDGALEIAHLDDTFISVEITTYFPEDRCKVHVLALDIDEPTFNDIQKLRPDIFELVPYLRQKNITHVCAHPLYAVNDRLTLDHFEQLLLLFKNLELNGARDGRPNELLRALAVSLTEEDMDRLANKHGIAPDYSEPWVKHLTGGSDDHGALNIARIHTEVKGARDLPDFLRGIAEGRSEPKGEAATPETMAHNLYAIAYQYYRNKFRLDRFTNKDIFLRFVDRFLAAEAPRESNLIDRLQAYWTTRKYMRSTRSASSRVQDVVRREAARLICDDPNLLRIAKSGVALPKHKGNEWARFVTGASNKVLNYFADSLLGHLSGGNVFDIFQTVGSAGALYTFMAPYFLAYTLFNQDRRLCRDVATAFRTPANAVARDFDAFAPPQRPVKVGHYTDTFFEINGVAKTLQRSVRIARKTGKDLTMITCDPSRRRPLPGVRNFQPIGVFDLPEYPEQKIFYPPVLEMVAHAFENEFTHIHSATPGPIGLAALLISRLFKLPIYGTYHTQIPQYAQQLTGDDHMEELTWKFTIWYYSQMDMVYAPSQATADELASKGLDREKVVVYPRGVDTELFHPAKRNGFLRRYNVPEGINLIYVGRISKEKNLEILADAYRQVADRHPRVNLIMVGDGPYMDEMKSRMRGLPCIFTGYLEGEQLAACYASSDLFVFPSVTDTFGNVVLEAQASGIPAVVSNCGGPSENVLHNKTGLIVDATTPAEFARAISSLVKAPDRLNAMGKMAREYTESRSFEQAFIKTWEIYRAAS